MATNNSNNKSTNNLSGPKGSTHILMRERDLILFNAYNRAKRDHPILMQNIDLDQFKRRHFERIVRENLSNNKRRSILVRK
jgi:hypothetical protein